MHIDLPAARVVAWAEDAEAHAGPIGAPVLGLLDPLAELRPARRPLEPEADEELRVLLVSDENLGNVALRFRAQDHEVAGQGHLEGREGRHVGA